MQIPHTEFTVVDEIALKWCLLCTPFSAAIYAYTLSHLGDRRAAVSMQINAWLINHEMILGLTDSNEGIPTRSSQNQN